MLKGTEVKSLSVLLPLQVRGLANYRKTATDLSDYLRRGTDIIFNFQMSKRVRNRPAETTQERGKSHELTWKTESRQCWLAEQHSGARCRGDISCHPRLGPATANLRIEEKFVCLSLEDIYTDMYN